MRRHAAAALALILASAAAPAAAKSSREYPYAYAPVWSALVRFLRVDENLRVVEKDEKTGYVVFELTDGKKTFQGAAELTRQDGGGTRVMVRLADRPSYMELGLLDRFADKLRDELGEPVQQPPPPPAPDAGPESKP